MRLLLPSMFVVSSLACAAQQPSSLNAYEECHFTNGLAVEHVDGLSPGVTARSVKTRHGTDSLRLLDGRRVMVGFPDDNFFANVKVELLAAAEYAQQSRSS